MQQKNYITTSGYNRLQNELNDLLTHERPTLVQTITWAAGNGDRSENGDYIYGKRKLREIDKRIRFLTHKLEDAVVVDPEIHQGNEQVFFGAQVTLLKNDETTQIITIVGQDEVDPHKNHISWTAPIARELLRKTIGDKFKFNSPSGICLIEIVDVEYIWTI